MAQADHPLTIPCSQLLLLGPQIRGLNRICVNGCSFDRISSNAIVNILTSLLDCIGLWMTCDKKMGSGQYSGGGAVVAVVVVVVVRLVMVAGKGRRLGGGTCVASSLTVIENLPFEK